MNFCKTSFLLLNDIILRREKNPIDVGTGDAEGLAKDFIDLGCIVGSTDRGAVVDALRRTFSTARKDKKLNFLGVLTDVRTALPTLSTQKRDAPLTFRVPPRFAPVVRALGALEGTVLAVDPSFQVVAAAYPHVARILVHDTSIAGRHALRSLVLYDNGAIRWNRLDALLKRTSQCFFGLCRARSKSCDPSFLSKTTKKYFFF